MTDASSSTGLPSRVAAPLSYAGWWITGIIFWLIERDDAYVRFHAAQAIAAFGAIAILTGGFLLLAAIALSSLPSAFPLFASAAGVVWVGGLVLWGVAMWRAATGRPLRIPLAARLADRLSRIGQGAR
jgi:uncharacterized membrane protein